MDNLYRKQRAWQDSSYTMENGGLFNDRINNNKQDKNKQANKNDRGIHLVHILCP